MEGTKPFYLTRRFWGPIITALGVVLPMAGVGDTEHIGELGNSAMNVVDAALIFAGLATSFVGGIRANKVMTFRKQ